MPEYFWADPKFLDNLAGIGTWADDEIAATMLLASFDEESKSP